MELKALRGRKYSAGYNGGLPFPYDAEKEIADVPETLDWRLFGAVTPVKGKSKNSLVSKVVFYSAGFTQCITECTMNFLINYSKLQGKIWFVFSQENKA